MALAESHAFSAGERPSQQAAVKPHSNHPAGALVAIGVAAFSREALKKNCAK
jgi:hypothetical protein